MDKIHRALICTSALQVITGYAAMNMTRISDYEYIDHLFVFHANLNGNENKIIRLGSILGFSKIYDLSSYVSGIEKKISLRSLQFFHNRKINDEIDLLIKKIRNEFGNVNFDKAFCIGMKSYLEFQLLNIIGVREYECIEDGIANYANHNSLIRLGEQIRAQTETFIRWLILKLIGIKSDYIKHLLPFNRLKRQNLYTTHSTEGAKMVKEDVVKIFKQYSNDSNTNLKAIICGSVFYTSSTMNVTVDKEVEIYKKVVDFVKKRHGLNDQEIGFKPHPRFGPHGTHILKQTLTCILLEDEYGVIEFEFTNPNLEAFYSFGSTSSINAKELFDLNSWFVWLDILNNDAIYRSLYKNISKRFNIPIIKLQ